ncbi:jmjC domain-containing protein 8 isoform X2 [Lepidochelys kempii]|uniref:jmjC domain-containing protein 8 isoform X2 n=1 Tax=Lepidochelys kempii TaxID=8472 RepID=UPI003C6ECF1C
MPGLQLPECNGGGGALGCDLPAAAAARRQTLFQPASLRESDTPDSRGLLGANGIVVAIPSPIHPIVAAWRLRLPGRKWGLADEQVFGSDGRRPLHGGEERCFPDLLPVHRPVDMPFPGLLLSRESRTTRNSRRSAQGTSCWQSSGTAWCVSALLTPIPTVKWMCHSRNTWSTCWSLRTWPPWAVTHCISLETITSQSGAPSSRNTCHLLSGFQAPAGPTALGSLRWFLYPPEKTPEFHPNKTTLSWLLDTYPFLPPEDRPVECTIHPGEVLYFPDRWWHATLNLDTSVFISTFLG